MKHLLTLAQQSTPEAMPTPLEDSSIFNNSRSRSFVAKPGMTTVVRSGQTIGIATLGI